MTEQEEADVKRRQAQFHECEETARCEMTCPKCRQPGYTPPRKGRPPKVDDDKIRQLKDSGLTGFEVAAQVGTSESSVWASLARAKKK
jgi:hypothetical protein